MSCNARLALKHGLSGDKSTKLVFILPSYVNSNLISNWILSTIIPKISIIFQPWCENKLL